MNVKFLVAEEVRPEAGGKVSILGFYAGDVIVMLKKERPKGIPANTPEGFERLAILATISNASEGTHKFKGKLIDPSGEEYAPESSLGEAAIPKGFTHVVVVELKPFIVKQQGTYTYEFFVNNEVFKFPFEVRIQDVQKAGIESIGN